MPIPSTPHAPRPRAAPSHGPASAAIRLAAATLALGSLLAPLASPAAGQDAADRGNPAAAGPADSLARGQVEISVMAGALAPLSRLTEDPETFSTELATSGLFAADAVYWGRSRFGVAARVAYAPATVAVVPGSIAGAVPKDLGPADYWALTAEGRMRFPSPGEGIAVTPYLSAGGGVRLLAVRALAGPEVEDSTDPVATVAAGLTMPLAAPVELRVEFRDHVTFHETPAGESRTQNELVVLVGGSVRVR